jgi:hypothetical protein
MTGSELVDKDLPVLSSELTWSRESATPSDDMVERFREVCSALVDKLSTHQAEDAQDTVVREFISSLWDIDLVPRTSTDGPVWYDRRRLALRERVEASDDAATWTAQPDRGGSSLISSHRRIR